LRLFSFGGYGLALAALAFVVFGAYDSYPKLSTCFRKFILVLDNVRIFVIFQVKPISNHNLSEESSRRDLLNHIAEHKSISKK